MLTIHNYALNNKSYFKKTLFKNLQKSVKIIWLTWKKADG